MLIADSQIHLWAADRPDRPWPPGGAQRAQKPYPVDKDMALAAMKEASVDRAVIVPPSWEGERNDVALEAARLHPDRFAVMGRFPLERPDSALVDGWRRQLCGLARHANVAVKASAIPSPTSTRTSAACTIRSARDGCSGERTGRVYPARGARR